MKKSNLKTNLAVTLTTLVIFVSLSSGFTNIKGYPEIKVEVQNNLNISHSTLFDGMVINYTTDMNGQIMNSGISYEYYAGSEYNASWWLGGLTTIDWVEDATNRQVIQDNTGSGFPVGTHSPFWIFTNVSLYDLILISVVGEGDHIFNITGEKICNLPGFGSVEVWELEGGTYPGEFAWYEKSTGILIKGNFNMAGFFYYAFDFLNTNAVFSNVAPVSGLFNLLFMEYNVSEGGMSYPMTTTYSGYSVNNYNNHIVTEGIPIGGWTVDTTTRLMHNVDGAGFNFNPGQYSPFWIFTNVSIGKNVSVAIMSEGDHIFEVTKSLNVEFPGFGLISVWELQDLDGYGGVAWYEKNSGILLNGTFIHNAGADNYSFNLLDTNANFGYLLPSTFTLSTDATDSDSDGDFNLNWTIAEFAKDYTIYEYSSYITTLNGSLTVIVNETTDMSHHLSGYNDGVYFFIAAAKNDHGISLSNVIMVTVDKPSGGGIPGYNMFFLAITTLSISILWIKKSKILRKVK